MIAKKNSTTGSRIRWSADNTILYFDGPALKMKDWKQFIEELFSTAEELLSQRLLFQEDGGLPEEDLKVIDDPSNHKAGHYFALDEPDSWMKARMMLIQNMRGTKHWDRMVDVQGDGINFFKAGVDE